MEDSIRLFLRFLYLVQINHQADLSNFIMYSKVTCYGTHCVPGTIAGNSFSPYKKTMKWSLFLSHLAGGGNLGIERLKNCPRHRALWWSWKLNPRCEDLECEHNGCAMHGVSLHRPKLALSHTFQMVLPYFWTGNTMYYSWNAYSIFRYPTNLALFVETCTICNQVSNIFLAVSLL